MTCSQMLQTKGYTLFNSHPHKEDDDVTICRFYIMNFSTHILTRRMTLQTLLLLCIYYFSTHILTRRMTLSRWNVNGWKTFSTHILTRRMTNIARQLDIAWNFSTHILTRRMTAAVGPVMLILSFQLTSSQGG